MNHYPPYQTNNQNDVPLCSKCSNGLQKTMPSVVKTQYPVGPSHLPLGAMVLAFIVVKIS